MNQVERFKALQEEAADLYEKKNRDYGNNFSKGFAEHGMAMPVMRIGDKFERMKQVTNNGASVSDESLRDTLIDLSNYALMTVMELDGKECVK